MTDKRPTYTQATHIERLRHMIRNKKSGCPAAKFFSRSKRPQDMWNSKTNPCQICMRFIIDDPNFDGKSFCPCTALGDAKAWYLTIEKLNNLEETKAGIHNQ